MERIIVINQPTYLPWLGYFEQMARADVFVFLDSVQFERASWQCRNRLEAKHGDSQRWLAVPVEKQPLSTRIHDVRISAARSDWGAQHLDELASRLGHAPHFRAMRDLVAPHLLGGYVSLAELNIALIHDIAKAIGLDPTLVRSSTLAVEGSKGHLVLDLVRTLGGTTYYAAAGSAAYLEPLRPTFEDAGVALVFQDWPHPVYAQGSAPFTSHLSVVDALAWVGAERVGSFVSRHLAVHAT